MYFHPYDQSYYPTYDFQNQDFRQFPGGGFPGGFPGGGGGGGQTDRRLDRLERQVERLDRRVDQLNRRLRRVERQLGYQQSQDQW